MKQIGQRLTKTNPAAELLGPQVYGMSETDRRICCGKNYWNRTRARMSIPPTTIELQAKQ
jgi:hypothetical protein